jgi:hypothetical protein
MATSLGVNQWSGVSWLVSERVREPSGRGMSAVESRYQKNGEDTAD